VHLLQGFDVSRPLMPDALATWRKTRAYASPTADL
jgi:hypothetical protein